MTAYQHKEVYPLGLQVSFLSHTLPLALKTAHATFVYIPTCPQALKMLFLGLKLVSHSCNSLRKWEKSSCQNIP